MHRPRRPPLTHHASPTSAPVGGQSAGSRLALCVAQELRSARRAATAPNARPRPRVYRRVNSDLARASSSRMRQEVEGGHGRALAAATIPVRARVIVLGHLARRCPGRRRGRSVRMGGSSGSRLAHVAAVGRAVARLAVVGIHREVDPLEVLARRARPSPKLAFSGSWMIASARDLRRAARGGAAPSATASKRRSSSRQ
mgnify:CR=1 FL=1